MPARKKSQASRSRTRIRLSVDATEVQQQIRLAREQLGKPIKLTLQNEETLKELSKLSQKLKQAFSTAIDTKPAQTAGDVYAAAVRKGISQTPMVLAVDAKVNGLLDKGIDKLGKELAGTVTKLSGLNPQVTILAKEEIGKITKAISRGQGFLGTIKQGVGETFGKSIATGFQLDNVLEGIGDRFKKGFQNVVVDNLDAAIATVTNGKTTKASEKIASLVIASTDPTLLANEVAPVIVEGIKLIFNKDYRDTLESIEPVGTKATYTLRQLSKGLKDNTGALDNFIVGLSEAVKHISRLKKELEKDGLAALNSRRNTAAIIQFGTERLKNNKDDAASRIASEFQTRPLETVHGIQAEKLDQARKREGGTVFVSPVPTFADIQSKHLEAASSVPVVATSIGADLKGALTLLKTEYALRSAQGDESLTSEFTEFIQKTEKQQLAFLQAYTHTLHKGDKGASLGAELEGAIPGTPIGYSYGYLASLTGQGTDGVSNEIEDLAKKLIGLRLELGDKAPVQALGYSKAAVIAEHAVVLANTVLERLNKAPVQGVGFGLRATPQTTADAYNPNFSYTAGYVDQILNPNIDRETKANSNSKRVYRPSNIEAMDSANTKHSDSKELLMHGFSAYIAEFKKLKETNKIFDKPSDPHYVSDVTDKAPTPIERQSYEQEKLTAELDYAHRVNSYLKEVGQLRNLNADTLAGLEEAYSELSFSKEELAKDIVSLSKAILRVKKKPIAEADTTLSDLPGLTGYVIQNTKNIMEDLLGNIESLAAESSIDADITPAFMAELTKLAQMTDKVSIEILKNYLNSLSKLGSKVKVNELKPDAVEASIGETSDMLYALPDRTRYAEENHLKALNTPPVKPLSKAELQRQEKKADNDRLYESIIQLTESLKPLASMSDANATSSQLLSSLVEKLGNQDTEAAKLPDLAKLPDVLNKLGGKLSSINANIVTLGEDLRELISLTDPQAIAAVTQAIQALNLHVDFNPLTQALESLSVQSEPVDLNPLIQAINEQGSNSPEPVDLTPLNDRFGHLSSYLANIDSKTDNTAIVDAVMSIHPDVVVSAVTSTNTVLKLQLTALNSIANQLNQKANGSVLADAQVTSLPSEPVESITKVAKKLSNQITDAKPFVSDTTDNYQSLTLAQLKELGTRLGISSKVLSKKDDALNAIGQANTLKRQQAIAIQSDDDNQVDISELDGFKKEVLGLIQNFKKSVESAEQALPTLDSSAQAELLSGLEKDRNSLKHLLGVIRLLGAKSNDRTAILRSEGLVSEYSDRFSQLKSNHTVASLPTELKAVERQRTNYADPSQQLAKSVAKLVEIIGRLEPDALLPTLHELPVGSDAKVAGQYFADSHIIESPIKRDIEATGKISRESIATLIHEMVHATQSYVKSTNAIVAAGDDLEAIQSHMAKTPDFYDPAKLGQKGIQQEYEAYTVELGLKREFLPKEKDSYSAHEFAKLVTQLGKVLTDRDAFLEVISKQVNVQEEPRYVHDPENPDRDRLQRVANALASYLEIPEQNLKDLSRATEYTTQSLTELVKAMVYIARQSGKNIDPKEYSKAVLNNIDALHGGLDPAQHPERSSVLLEGAFRSTATASPRQRVGGLDSDSTDPASKNLIDQLLTSSDNAAALIAGLANLGTQVAKLSEAMAKDALTVLENASAGTTEPPPNTAGQSVTERASGLLSGNLGEKAFNIGGSLLKTVASVTLIKGLFAGLLDVNYEVLAQFELMKVQLEQLGGAGSLDKVVDKANEFGLNFEVAARNAAKISANLAGSNFESQGVELANSLSKAKPLLNLSTEEFDRFVLALNQAQSKGRLASEEYTGQLAEIPGALNLLSASLGKSTVDLAQQVRAGQAYGDILVEVATYLDKATVNTDTLSASQDRLKNAVDLSTLAAQSGFGEVAKVLNNTLANALNFANEHFQALGTGLAIGLAAFSAKEIIAFIQILRTSATLTEIFGSRIGAVLGKIGGKLTGQFLLPIGIAAAVGTVAALMVDVYKSSTKVNDSFIALQTNLDRAIDRQKLLTQATKEYSGIKFESVGGLAGAFDSGLTGLLGSKDSFTERDQKILTNPQLLKRITDERLNDKAGVLQPEYKKSAGGAKYLLESTPDTFKAKQLVNDLASITGYYNSASEAINTAINAIADTSVEDLDGKSFKGSKLLAELKDLDDKAQVLKLKIDQKRGLGLAPQDYEADTKELKRLTDLKTTLGSQVFGSIGGLEDLSKQYKKAAEETREQAKLNPILAVSYNNLATNFDKAAERASNAARKFREATTQIANANKVAIEVSKAFAALDTAKSRSAVEQVKQTDYTPKTEGQVNVASTQISNLQLQKATAIADLASTRAAIAKVSEELVSKLNDRAKNDLNALFAAYGTTFDEASSALIDLVTSNDSTLAPSYKQILDAQKRINDERKSQAELTAQVASLDVQISDSSTDLLNSTRDFSLQRLRFARDFELGIRDSNQQLTNQAADIQDAIKLTKLDTGFARQMAAVKQELGVTLNSTAKQFRDVFINALKAVQDGLRSQSDLRNKFGSLDRQLTSTAQGYQREDISRQDQQVDRAIQDADYQKGTSNGVPFVKPTLPPLPGQSNALSKIEASGNEMAIAIRKAAQRLGVTAEDVATIIQIESSFANKRNGGSGGRYQGYFQFGNPAMTDVRNNRLAPTPKGLNAADYSFKDQAEFFTQYALSRGFKPGMGVRKLYTTHNLGNPNATGVDGFGTPGGLTSALNPNSQERKWAKTQLNRLGVAFAEAVSNFTTPSKNIGTKPSLPPLPVPGSASQPPVRGTKSLPPVPPLPSLNLAADPNLAATPGIRSGLATAQTNELQAQTSLSLAQINQSTAEQLIQSKETIQDLLITLKAETVNGASTLTDAEKFARQGFQPLTSDTPDLELKDRFNQRRSQVANLQAEQDQKESFKPTADRIRAAIASSELKGTEIADTLLRGLTETEAQFAIQVERIKQVKAIYRDASLADLKLTFDLRASEGRNLEGARANQDRKDLVIKPLNPSQFDEQRLQTAQALADTLQQIRDTERSRSEENRTRLANETALLQLAKDQNQSAEIQAEIQARINYLKADQANIDSNSFAINRVKAARLNALYQNQATDQAEQDARATTSSSGRTRYLQAQINNPLTGFAEGKQYKQDLIDQEYLDGLREINRLVAEQTALFGGNNEALQAYRQNLLDALGSETQKKLTESNEYINIIADAVGSNFTSTVEAVSSRQKGLLQGLQDFGLGVITSVRNSLLQMVQKLLVSGILKLLSKFLGGASGIGNIGTSAVSGGASLLGAIGFSDGGEVTNFSEGGTVNNTVQNFADGGAALLGMSALAALEREGSNAVLAALTPGEQVLTNKNRDADVYRQLEATGQWAEIKASVGNYADGGTVGSASVAIAAKTSKSKSLGEPLPPILVSIYAKDVDSFNRSQDQVTVALARSIERAKAQNL